jgi:general stress protein 26
MAIKQNAEKLYKKVNTFRLTCVGADDYQLAKAVVPRKHRESINKIYFLHKYVVKVCCQNKQKSQSKHLLLYAQINLEGCVLKGKMEIVSNPAIKEKYWQNKFKDAYPEKSYTDPDFCVLKFVLETSRFYSWYKSEDFEI